MLETLQSFYADNNQYAPRFTADTWFRCDGIRGDYTGTADYLARFIEKVQLKDRALWKIFVHQFAAAYPDGGDNAWRGEYWGKQMRGGGVLFCRQTGGITLPNKKTSPKVFGEGGRCPALCAEREFSPYAEACAFARWQKFVKTREDPFVKGSSPVFHYLFISPQTGARRRSGRASRRRG